jgi:hypothetical protein
VLLELINRNFSYIFVECPAAAWSLSLTDPEESEVKFRQTPFYGSLNGVVGAFCVRLAVYAI